MSTVIFLPPLAAQASTSVAVQAAAALKGHTPVHQARIIGAIRAKPRICGPGYPSPPPPSLNSLAFVAESSLNEVQAINEATGALVGTPITVGTSPVGVGYWRPATSSGQDPQVIATNSASHSVTVIDAVLRTITATINVPGGSSAQNAVGSPTQPYALVTDKESGNISVINLANNTDAGEIALSGAGSYVLSSIAFSSSGAYAYVTDPSQHKIFVLQYTGGSAPYYSLLSTYTNSAINPTGIATDMSTSSSNTLLVTNAQSSSGSLLSVSDASGTLSAPTTVKTFASTVPGAVSLAPGGATAWVAMTGTKTVNVVTVASGATTNYTVSSGFTSVGPMGLSADGSTLFTADTGSATVQGTATTSGLATNATFTDGFVSSIAPALGTSGSWDAYVVAGGYVDVVNSTTQSVTQQIADSHGPVSVATSPDGQYVYVANQTTPSVTVIRTAYVGTSTNPVIATITISQGSEPNAPVPYGIAVNPQGTSLLVGDQGNGAVDVIDLNSADTTQFDTIVTRIGLTGSGIHSGLAPESVTVGPDGRFAYVSENSTTSSTDGVVVLQLASATTTGYTFLADNEALAQGSDTMFAPVQIAIDPNDESAYVAGFWGSGNPGAVFKFPIGTNGQLSNGAGSPVSIGFNPAGVVFSPEDASAFATSTTDYQYSSISETYGTDNYDASTSSMPGAIAVSPDGLYVAVGESHFCGTGSNSLGIYNAGNGVVQAVVGLSASPQSIAFVPQSSPRIPPITELVGGASNPAEAGVSSGMNDVVTSGTPSDAPGATAGVDTATGAYSFSLDSMSVPDIGIGLSQSATYDSGRAATSGLLGHGWEYSYGITASQNAHDAATNPCAIVVTQENGSTVTFFPSLQGPYTTCPASGYQARGRAQATMTFAASCNGADACYVMTRGAMMKYYIDETNGELVKIVDLHGNTVTISWGSHTACSGATSTEPCQVTAPDGTRTLTYSYPSAGSGTCPSTASSCVVVADPLGRTITYTKDSSGRLVSASLSNGTQTATYVFTYSSSSLMTSWWDPQNNANHAASTAYATDVTWTGTLATQVTGPTMTNAGTSMTATYLPETTFSYTGFNPTTGNGAVLVANPNYNQSSAMYGANLTLDTYADFELVSSVQGYGPLGDYGSATLLPTPSESAVPMRDLFTLMPAESMNALSGAWVGPVVSGQASEYDSGVTINIYDVNGNVLQSVDPSGDTTTRQYNGLNEATVSVDAIGNGYGVSGTVVAAHTTTNTYNVAGDLTSMTSPATEDWLSNPANSNYYDTNGALCASRTANEVSAYGALTSCSASHATVYTYNASGDQTATTDPMGGVSESSYDANGNLCATLTPDGYALGETLSSCPSSGHSDETISLTWSVYLQPTETVAPTNAAGGTTWTYFDLNNNQIASVYPLGNPSSCDPLTTGTCAYTSYSGFDAMGHKTSGVSQTATSGTMGPLSSSFYDPDGVPVAIVSSAGNASGSPSNYEHVTVVNNIGSSVVSTPASNLGSGSCSVTSTTLPCPNTTVSTFDRLGAATGAIVAKGGESGSTTTSTTATFNPDATAANGTVPTTSGTVATSTNVFDVNGNLLETKTAAPSTSTIGGTTTFEPSGKVCWSTPTAWTGSGIPSCDLPPTGAGTMTTTNYYDATGNLIAISGPGSNPYATGNTSGCNPLSTSTCSLTTYYSYDENGHRLTETQPVDASGNYPVVTSYYDASGSVVAVTGPGGSPSTCNPLTTSTCVDTIYKTIDADGRVTQVTYSDATHSTSYTFNDDGTRATMVDGTGTTNYYYDLVGRITKKVDGASNTVTYGYDGSGQLICLSYRNASSNTCTTAGAGTSSPPSGDVTYSYDTQGRLSAIATWAGTTLTYAYDCAGNIAWVSTGSTSGSSCTPTSPIPLAIPSATSAVTTQYGYSYGQSTSIGTSTNNGSSNLLNFALTRDGDGNLLTSTPKVGSTTLAADNYSYDSSSRVASGPIVGSSGSPSYSYSSAGSVTTATTNFASASYSESGELCWSLPSSSSNSCGTPPTGATSYSYNPSGDRLSVVPPTGGNPSSLAWNQASSQLICVNSNGSTCSTSSPTSTTSLYSYDGDGLRSSSVYQGSTTTFTWDALTQRLLASGSTDYIYGLNTTTPAIQITPYGTTPIVDMLVQDGNQNTRGIVEVTGGSGVHNLSLVAYVDYDAYGSPITQSGGVAVSGGLTSPSSGYSYSTTPFGFGAGYLDSSGYVYLVNRYLDPTAGQFVSVDPLLDMTSAPYLYATDNPVNATDVFGLCSWWDLPCLIAEQWDAFYHAMSSAFDMTVSFIKTAISIAMNPAGAVQGTFVRLLGAVNKARSCKCVFANMYGFTNASLRAIARISYMLRGPDWLSLSLTGGVFVGGGIVFTLARHGGMFMEPEVGATTPGGDLLGGAGWIWSKTTPSTRTVNDFIHSWALAVEGVVGPGFVVGDGLIWGSVLHGGLGSFGSSIVGGGGTPNASLFLGYAFHIADTGVMWKW